MMHYILEEKILSNEFYAEFIRFLIEKDIKCQNGNLKHYANSLVHRERFRLWQCVLIILPRLNEVIHLNLKF